jgi:hypothetical protein
MDDFITYEPQLDSPAQSFYAISPNDGEMLPKRPRAIRVGAAGDVVAVSDDGVAVTFNACYAGEWLPIRPVQIKATGTTAGALVAVL